MLATVRKKRMNKVSCIIPAYNEGSRIQDVLRIVSDHPLVAEVIVVDDGSTDNTAEQVHTFPSVVLLSQKVNKGKSYSVVTGIRKAVYPYIMLIDADLSGLSKQDISNLITPVITNEADVTVSLRANTPFLWRLLNLDYLSGERVFKKAFIEPYLDTIANLPGFGLETFLNERIVEQQARLRVVRWPQVKNTSRRDKNGTVRGLVSVVGMVVTIIGMASLLGIAHQIISLRRARVE